METLGWTAVKWGRSFSLRKSFSRNSLDTFLQAFKDRISQILHSVTLKLGNGRDRLKMCCLLNGIFHRYANRLPEDAGAFLDSCDADRSDPTCATRHHVRRCKSSNTLLGTVPYPIPAGTFESMIFRTSPGRICDLYLQTQSAPFLLVEFCMNLQFPLGSTIKYSPRSIQIAS